MLYELVHCFLCESPNNLTGSGALKYNKLIIILAPIRIIIWSACFRISTVWKGGHLIPMTPLDPPLPPEDPEVQPAKDVGLPDLTEDVTVNKST